MRVSLNWMLTTIRFIIRARVREHSPSQFFCLNLEVTESSASSRGRSLLGVDPLINFIYIFFCFLLLFPVGCGFSKYRSRSGCVHESKICASLSAPDAPLQRLADGKLCSAVSLIFATSSRSNRWTNGFLNPKNYVTKLKEGTIVSTLSYN